MSKDYGSSDNYHRSTSYPRRDERDRTLPSIHEVLEDVLAQPARPRHGAYTLQIPPGLPPLMDTSRSNEVLRPSEHDPFGYPRPHATLNPCPDQIHRDPPRYHSSRPQAPNNMYNLEQQRDPRQSNYLYGLYRSSSTGELIHEQTSNRDYFPQRPARSDPGPMLRRHVCDECGEAFDRRSSLDTHVRTHTGVKPFRCGHPGCNKRFTVKSNMRRHERTHGAPSAFMPAEVHREDYRLDPSRASSSYPSRGRSSSTTSQSSSADKPSSRYYSSSYR